MSALSCVSTSDCQAVGVSRNTYTAGHLFNFTEHAGGAK
jgi:hypothetical protein